MTETSKPVAVADLHPSPNNPNKMEPERYAALVTEMREVGFVQPILVRERPAGGYQIVDGHHRARAAQELGITHVPAIVKDLDDATANALQIAMNRLRGELDLAAVAPLLADLKLSGWTLDDLAMTGFSSDEIRDLLAAVEQPAPDDLPDSVTDDPEPEAPKGEYVLELAFGDKSDMAKAKRVLKKAAGKKGSLADGLLALLS